MICLRHCERAIVYTGSSSPSVRGWTSEAIWEVILDCFVAYILAMALLAMTALNDLVEFRVYLSRIIQFLQGLLILQ